MKCIQCSKIIRYPSSESKFSRTCGMCRRKIPDQLKHKLFAQFND